MIFKNLELVEIVNFLGTVPLKSKLSRKRTKLQNKLLDLHKEFEEDRISIMKEHALKNEDGSPKTKDDGKVFDIPKGKEKFVNDEFKELQEEDVEIKQGDYSDNYKILYEYLNSDNFNMELSRQDASAYDRLMEEFEKDIDKESIKETAE